MTQPHLSKRGFLDSSNFYSSSSQPNKLVPLSSRMNNGQSPSAGLAFDPSEFPPIRPGGASTAPGSSKVQSAGTAAATGVSAVSAQLPSFGSAPASGLGHSSSSATSSVAATAPANSAQQPPQVRSYLYALSQQQQQQQQKGGPMAGECGNGPDFFIDQDFPALPGSQQATAQARLSQTPTPQPFSIPKDMITDHFGMLGLLKLIHVGEHDSTLNMLAPGLDLTSLNINWQMQGRDLFNSFISPCHDSCMGRPQDLDYPVPSEYLVKHEIGDQLPDPSMDKLAETTLFWLFYNCCQEEVQLVTAKELYKRQWWFHKTEQVWVTRMTEHDCKKEKSFEQGYYYYWDPAAAQKLQRQMTIRYVDLDETPPHCRTTSGLLSATIEGPPRSAVHPSAVHHHQQQQQAAAAVNAHLLLSKPYPKMNPMLNAASFAPTIGRPVQHLSSSNGPTQNGPSPAAVNFALADEFKSMVGLDSATGANLPT